MTDHLHADTVTRIADLAATIPNNVMEIGDGPTARLAALLPEGYRLEVEDIAPDERTQDRPHQAAGNLTAADLPSFVALVAKHATSDAEIYANPDASTITCLFDGGGRVIRAATVEPALVETANENTVEGDAPQLMQIDPIARDTLPRPTTTWADWRATLAVPVDPDWRAWSAIDGKLMPQQQFAEFLEQHTSAVLEPSAGELYDIATTLEVQQSARYGNATRTTSGERVLIIEEGHDVRAGQSRELRFPDRISLLLRPWLDARPEPVTALLRYRLQSGVLSLGVTLVGVEEFRRKVWTDLIDDLATRINDIDPGILVVNGTAPAPRR